MTASGLNPRPFSVTSTFRHLLEHKARGLIFFLISTDFRSLLVSWCLPVVILSFKRQGISSRVTIPFYHIVSKILRSVWLGWLWLSVLRGFVCRVVQSEAGRRHLRMAVWSLLIPHPYLAPFFMIATVAPEKRLWFCMCIISGLI